MPALSAKPGIYRIAIGRWYYYGSSLNPRKRAKNHRARLRAGKHENPILQRCYDKHGDAAFRARVVERVPHRGELLAREQVWLDKYVGRTYCANIVKVAGACPTGPTGPRGHAVKKKISDTMRRKGIAPTKEARRKGAEAMWKPVVIRFDNVATAAARLGVTVRSLQRWMSGQHRWPKGLTGGFA